MFLGGIALLLVIIGHHDEVPSIASMDLLFLPVYCAIHMLSSSSRILLGSPILRKAIGARSAFRQVKER